jgi:hypothetical protein
MGVAMNSLRFVPVAIAALIVLQDRSFGQQTWLTDEESREVAAATIRAVYPEKCYSTYRKEDLESSILSVRREKLIGRDVNRSVYIYDVTADTCDYVVIENGHPELQTQVICDGAGYGLVAVDRRTRKSYWFGSNEKRADVFKRFVDDEQLVLSKRYPDLFFSLYRDLVLGASETSEVTDLSQLRRLAEANFQSAYSPYEIDDKWESKFSAWWRRLRSQQPHLKLETTTEVVSDGVIFHGYAFNGFALTIPRSDPPPKGTPRLTRWSLKLKADGTAERLASITVYPAANVGKPRG